MAKVEIYTQPGCPYCRRALGLLRDRHADIREIDAPHGTDGRREATTRSGGRTTVPQIFIDGALVGGCDDLVALERRGGLDALLGAV